MLSVSGFKLAYSLVCELTSLNHKTLFTKNIHAVLGFEKASPTKLGHEHPGSSSII